MKKLLIATSVSLAFIAAQATLAMPPKPAKCPGVKALKTSEFDIAQQDKDGTWVAGVIHNNYDTKDAWTFAIGKINATSQQDAMDKAEAGLKTLTFQTGPIAVEKYNLWACGYYTGEGYPAVAVTPALGFNTAAQLVK